MPPKLALYGGFVFILLVFYWDRKKYPDAPGGLWLPTLWMMRCGSRSIDSWLSGDEFGRMDPILIGVLIVSGLAALARRQCNWQQIFAHNWAVFVFYAYLFLSVLWCDSLENPLVKVLRPSGDLIMALLVATTPDPRKSLITMARRTAILLIPMSIILIKYFHELGTMQDKHWGEDSWIGVTTHKNPLGQLSLMAALTFLWSLSEARRNGEKWWRQPMSLLYLGFVGYLMYGGGNEASRSSTSMLCLMTALALFFIFGRMRSRIPTIVRSIATGAAAFVLVIVVLQLLGTSLQAVVAGLMGKDPTLTDRTYLWRDVIRLGMEHPLLGSGYGGFWVPSLYPRLSPEVDNGPMQAHNGYLETFANLGIIGLILLGLVILQSLRSASASAQHDFEFGRLRLALLFTILLLNYSEATFTVGCHLWWFLFLAIAVYAKPWMHTWTPAMPAGIRSAKRFNGGRKSDSMASAPCLS